MVKLAQSNQSLHIVNGLKNSAHLSFITASCALPKWTLIYHGTWFSVLFEKRFLSFVNRQGDRFATFGEFEDISQHIRSTIPEDVSDAVLEAIDYTRTMEKLAMMKEKSLDYLRRALKL